jgi:hypothetical protein
MIGPRVWGFRFEFWVYGSCLSIQGLEFRVLGSRVWDFGFRVWNLRFGV